MNIFRVNKVPRSVWTNPIHFIACGFGIGAMPIAPGTFGTLVGVIFYLMLNRLPLISYIGVAVLLFVIGVVITGITNRDFGEEDHPAAVWDEVVGFLFVMIAIPPHWYFILLGFILFRIFDILKPWPIKLAEHIPPVGLGVMADDLVAAIYSWIILFILKLIF